RSGGRLRTVFTLLEAVPALPLAEGRLAVRQGGVMRGYVRLCGSIIVAVLAPEGAGHCQGGDLPPIAVVAYNYAAVPPARILAAREHVIRIYRDAGVNVVWIDRSLDPGERSTDPTATSPSMFMVRLLIRPRRITSRRSDAAEMGEAY